MSKHREHLTIHKEAVNKPIPKVLAITGGKGGVGKTSLAVNLAIALSRNGKNVCLFDADTGLANLNIMLGLTPSYSLEHLFTGEKSIQDIVIEGPEGIHLVPGGSGCAQCVELDVGQQQRLVSSLQAIEQHYDYMLVDTAAGIAPTVLHFIAAAQMAMVVLTPEPTSLTDAFSLLKVLKRRGYKRKVQVVVNMASSAAQVDRVYRRFDSAVAKYLGMKTEYVGSVWMDESMRAAVTLQRPVALFPKEDPSARSFYRLAERIEQAFVQPKVPRLAFSAYWQKLVEAYAVRKLRELRPGPDSASPSASELAQSLGINATESPNAGALWAQDTASDKVSDSAQTSAQDAKPQALESVQASISKSAGQARQPASVTALFPKDANAARLLDPGNEQDWLRLRTQLSQFVDHDNATAEQLGILMSSLAAGLKGKTPELEVAILCNMLSHIKPEQLQPKQRSVLQSELQRLNLHGAAQSSLIENSPVERSPLERSPVEPGLAKYASAKPAISDAQISQELARDHDEQLPAEALPVQEFDDEVIEVALERYDEQGFGCQQSLADKIRNASDNVPLEHLLESIKQAQAATNLERAASSTNVQSDQSAQQAPSQDSQGHEPDPSN